MRKIIRSAVAHDATLCGVLLVGCFLKRQPGDQREQRLLLGAADEVFLKGQSVRKRLKQILQLGAFSRRVTNSSATVGWMPMVASNCALVAPSLTAMATPWITSPASGPIMCAPTTRWLERSTTSFMKVRSFFSVMVSLSARKEAL